MTSGRWLAALMLASTAIVGLGVMIGSTGWSPLWNTAGDAAGLQIVRDIRLPRALGAWAVGALLGLAGAIAQGLFRNPLADPYLLGSAAGASLGVAVVLAAFGLSPAATAWSARLGLTGAAFLGALAAVLLTLSLARGVTHGLRLLLAGVVVGVVLGAVAEGIKLLVPDILRAMQAFMLGSTAFLGWSGVGLLFGVLLVCGLTGLTGARVLDALALGEDAARSLGLPLNAARVVLVAVLSLATAAAVAQAGLIAFVGLVAPHLVRSRSNPMHAGLLLLSAATGGLLLASADVLGRWVVAPEELPVGVITAVLGGGYLLWLMHRRPMGALR